MPTSAASAYVGRRRAPRPAPARSRCRRSGCGLPGARRTAGPRPDPLGQQAHLGVAEQRRRQRPGTPAPSCWPPRGGRAPVARAASDRPTRGADQRAQRHLLRTQAEGADHRPGRSRRPAGPAPANRPGRPPQREPSTPRSSRSAATTPGSAPGADGPEPPPPKSPKPTAPATAPISAGLAPR